MRLGILGGGQLAWMLALAGSRLDVSATALEPAEDPPAAPVAAIVRAAYDDPAGLDELAAASDVVTFEFENVPAAAAERLADQVPVHPPPAALAVAQDRLREKRLFEGLGIDVPAFAPVDDAAGLRAALDACGLPAVLKTRREGYDGKGQRVVRTPAEAEQARLALGGAGLILEALVPFDRELSVIAVRARDGAVAVWPVVENEHRGGILRVSRAPAEDVPAAAEEAARRVLEALDYVGVLALELFQAGGAVLANELAPRVHNSGHWTIEGAVTSQFANHVRGVVGLPLGSVELVAPSAMVNLIGGLPDLENLADAVPGARVHVYGKAPRPGRKLGHVTLVGAALDGLPALRRLADAAGG